MKNIKPYKLFERVDFKSEEQIINDILLEIKDSNFYIDTREEETDNPNKTFLLIRIQYDLNPEDEMWELQRAYNIPILSQHTFKWIDIKDTIIRLVNVFSDIPNIDLYFMKYAKMDNINNYDKIEFIYSRGDGDDLSIVENTNIKEYIQFVDIVFVKEL